MNSRHWIVGLLGLVALIASCQSKSKLAGREWTPSEKNEVNAVLKSLPDVKVPPFDETQALALVAMPLACLDHPQARPAGPAYLFMYDGKPRLMEDYDKNRAFYGCFDWHSAVNSSWTMVAILKKFPNLPAAKLIREKLNDHLGQKNIEGEVAFFKEAKTFEQPYGRAWVLKLNADLATWDDEEGRKWVEHLAPLVKQFAANLLEYVKNLPYVIRTGAHTNTAYSMSLMLDYAEVANDKDLHEAVLETAKRIYLADKDCPTGYEPAGSEFLSPCLEEAKLMARVLDGPDFLTWFNAFMPPVNAPQFKPLTQPYDTSGITKQDQLAGKSHLIGLAFSRAEAMLRIADALPGNDPRGPVYRRTAAVNGRQGFLNLAGAGYFGSHWLGTYAVRYYLAMKPQPAPAGAAVSGN